MLNTLSGQGACIPLSTEGKHIGLKIYFTDRPAKEMRVAKATPLDHILQVLISPKLYFIPGTSSTGIIQCGIMFFRSIYIRMPQNVGHQIDISGFLI